MKKGQPREWLPFWLPRNGAYAVYLLESVTDTETYAIWSPKAVAVESDTNVLSEVKRDLEWN